MSSAGFQRLFNDWDHDGDITMVDLGSENHDREMNKNTNAADLERSGSRTSRHSSVAHQSYTVGLDESSSLGLIHNGDQSTDYAKSKGLPDLMDGGESSIRRRQKFTSKLGSNLQLWRKKSTGFLSQRTQSTFDGEFAHGRPGLWDKQMLVDRSLRSMAAFMAVCAIVMFIIVMAYVPAFVHRVNRSSTSVGGKEGESCHTAESRNIAIHLAINIAATLVLGCSNTYQQLVTALKVSEIKWALSKRGDSKVGTNSPWSINHKRDGKLTAWGCWILLISTSMPIHFLANSVIGPSFYVTMPKNVTYYPQTTPMARQDIGTRTYDAACWSAFRTKEYRLPEDVDVIAGAYNLDELNDSVTFQTVEVKYDSNCTAYAGTGTFIESMDEWNKTINSTNHNFFRGKCRLGLNVDCVLSDRAGKTCRINVRMQAALILLGCLLIKAAYMIGLNIRARHRVKEHCLTYGDIIVASVINSDLKIRGECLLNSGDGFRQKVSHTCHKHCKDPVPSSTGDAIGHCQKCEKFNDIDKSASLPHPTIAIKYKRSLLSNLGSTAIVQMLILTICSISMLTVSIILALSMAGAGAGWNEDCSRKDPTDSKCTISKTEYLGGKFGTWGGFTASATLSALPPNQLSSEFMGFAISNGAQFLYSGLYMLLIYNLSLISMEHEWGRWEIKRRRPRCTIVSGRQFEQSYFLQLPSKVILPLMAYTALMHWLLGQAISTAETIYSDDANGIQHSLYYVTYAAYPIYLSTVLMIAMTAACWWAFTFTREGFIPQMYGSIRTCCASTTELTDFNSEGIQWGDLGMGEKFRHAGFTSDEPSDIVPAELYS